MSDVFFIVLMVLLFIVVVIVVPQWMLTRNVPKVIRIFRQENAVGEKNAKTIEELGLVPKSMFQRMFTRRDYKPQSLQLLIRTTIVEMTEEGKVYLNEENLMQTKWRNL